MKPTLPERNNYYSDSETKTVATRTTTQRTVLLQTANAFAMNKLNSKSFPVRILFDNGSQHSYVTSQLKKRSDLKPIKTEALYLNTFGQSNYWKEKCEVLKLHLKKQDQEVDIIALDYPVICYPLPSKI